MVERSLFRSVFKQRKRLNLHCITSAAAKIVDAKWMHTAERVVRLNCAVRRIALQRCQAGHSASVPELRRRLVLAFSFKKLLAPTHCEYE
jgi:hypothetical protein